MARHRKNDEIPMFKIRNNILTLMLNATVLPYESGGIIGGNNNIITHFEFDKNNPIKDKNMYIPNIAYLNKIISEWDKQSVELYGIFHTHPKGQNTLSKDDMNFIYSFFEINVEVNELYFPIIIPHEQIYFYKAVRKNNGISIYLEGVDII